MKIDGKSFAKHSLLILLIAIALAANFYALYVHVRSNAISGKEKEVMRSAMELNYFFVESVDAIRLTSKTVDDMKRSGSSTDEILTYLENTSNSYGSTINRNFTGFYGYISGEYLDGAGWVPEEGYEPTQRPWYTEAIESDGDVTFVSPYVDMQTGTVTISVSEMLSDGFDVVSVDITLDDIQRLLEESVIQNDWKYGMILDADGVVVAHSEEGEIGKNYYKEESGMAGLFSKKFAGSDKNYNIITYGGKRYITIYSDISDGWKVVSVIAFSDVLGSTWIILIIFLATFIIIISIVIVVNINIRKKQLMEIYLNRQMYSMANIYDFAYLIDIKDNTIFEMSENNSEVKMLIDDGNDNAQYKLRVVMDAIADKRYKKSMFEFIDFSTIDERLSGKKVISRMFMDNKNQKYGIRIAPVQKDEDGKIYRVIFMIENLEND